MLKLGVLGTGFIANYVMDTCPNIRSHLVAVLGVDEKSANSYADKYHLEKRYTNIDDMLRDEEIDVIYIALPNHLHYSYAKKVLEAKKHCIVEKPFVANVKELDDLKNIAIQNQVFLFSAIPSFFNPLMKTLKESISKVGELRNVYMSYCQHSKHYDNIKNGIIHPVFNLEHDGGALKDLGIYPITMNVILFGKPKKAVYYANKLDNGCDSSGTIVMQYENFISTVRIAKDSFTENVCSFEGDKGLLLVDDNPCFFPNLRFVAKAYEEAEELGRLNTSLHANEFEVFFNTINYVEYDKSLIWLEQNKDLIETMDMIAISANLKYGK